MMNVRDQSEAVQSAEVSCTLRASQMIELQYLIAFKKVVVGLSINCKETDRNKGGF